MNKSLLVLLAYVCTTIFGQVCEEYAGSPLSFGFCDPFVGGQILIPPNTTQQSLDASVAAELKGFLFNNSQDCITKVAELLCQTTFLSCYPPYGLPSFPCKSKCLLAVEACGPYYFDCNAQESELDQDIWPTNCTSYNFGFEIINVPCNNTEPSAGVDLIPLFCPFPMAVHTNTDQPPCQLRCPNPIFTPREWDALEDVAFASAWLAFLGDLFLIASFCLNPPKRMFPFNLFFNLFGANFALTFMILVEDWYGIESFLCHYGSLSTPTSFPLCSFQGVVIFFAGLVIACWWIVIVLNLYLMLNSRVTVDNQKKFEKRYYVFAWGVPLIILIVALCSSSFGAADGSLICFLREEWAQNVYFYAPLGIMSLLGGIIIANMLYKASQSFKKIKEIDPTQKWPYFRVSFFSISFFLIFVLLILTRFAEQGNVNAISASVTAWVECHVEMYIQNLPSISACGEVPPKRPTLALQELQYVMFSLHGIFLLLFFLFDKDLWQGWHRVVLRVTRRAYPQRRMSMSPAVSRRTSMVKVEV